MTAMPPIFVDPDDRPCGEPHKLEAEMCSWDPLNPSAKSPNRIDALVHAMKADFDETFARGLGHGLSENEAAAAARDGVAMRWLRGQQTLLQGDAWQ